MASTSAVSKSAKSVAAEGKTLHTVSASAEVTAGDASFPCAALALLANRCFLVSTAAPFDLRRHRWPRDAAKAISPLVALFLGSLKDHPGRIQFLRRCTDLSFGTSQSRRSRLK